MKKLMVFAACAALAACGSKEEKTPESTNTAAATASGTATGDVTGTYEIKLADGSVALQTINSDGTYVETTPDGDRTGGGRWRTGDDGAMCFDPEGNESEECYTGAAPGEDGSFAMQDEDGNTTTVRKVDGGATPTNTPAT